MSFLKPPVLAFSFPYDLAYFLFARRCPTRQNGTIALLTPAHSTFASIICSYLPEDRELASKETFSLIFSGLNCSSLFFVWFFFVFSAPFFALFRFSLFCFSSCFVLFVLFFLFCSRRCSPSEGFEDDRPNRHLSQLGRRFDRIFDLFVMFFKTTGKSLLNSNSEERAIFAAQQIPLFEQWLVFPFFQMPSVCQ